MRTICAPVWPEVAEATGTTTIAQAAATFDLQRSATRTASALAFRIDATSIALPAGFRWALGPQIATLHLRGTLHGLVPDALTPVARAVAWRNEGGSLELRHLALHWGPLELSGRARLALDQQLQPAGDGTIRAVGYDATLDAMADAGVLTRTAALAAKAVLSLMATHPDQGQPSEVEVPLHLQDRTLSVRHAPLLRLPYLDWSAQ